MSGEELIERICEILRKDDERLHDSNIISRLHKMSRDELMALIKSKKGALNDENIQQK